MQTETDLSVPYGQDSNGKLIHVNEADNNSRYFCPACKLKLVQREGEIRTKHFSHPSNSNCDQETILHITAKILVSEVIDNNASGLSTPISLSCICTICNQQHYKKLLSKTFCGASIEKKVGPYICDVVAKRDEIDALAIEIVVTHHIESEKVINLSLPWIEIKAEDIISDAYQWTPISSNLKDTHCESCKNSINMIFKTAERWGFDSKVYNPLKQEIHKPYVAALERCLNCNLNTPVFWWSDIPFCEFVPPEPRPHTIVRRYSITYGGTYWMNTCANCGSTLEDMYLFLKNKAVLSHLPLSITYIKQQESVSISKLAKKFFSKY